MSILFVSAALLSTVLAVVIFWRLWPRLLLKPPETLARAVGVALGLLLFSLFPAVLILDALGAAQITYYVRGGPNPIYVMSQQPVLYWLVIAFLYAVFLFFFVGCAFMLTAARKPTAARSRERV
jgi:hypothetical protein